ncbi:MULTISPECIES: bifunctional phosphoribosylaminoimidazolecarboxamide formyltransferase/IMP cyclohydrolase [unclassified Geodermatophilus]
MPAAVRPERARVVVLLSGTGSLCASLLAAADDAEYPAEVVAVGSDRDAAGLEHARRRGLPTFTVRLRDFPDRAAWDAALAGAIAAHRPDWVVSAGFMRIVGPAVLARYEGRLVNTHPALLPAFPGAHAVRDALAAGVPVTGSTVHLVDAGVDTGPVLAQREVAVLPGDDEDRLHERIKAVERTLLVETVARLVTGTEAAPVTGTDDRVPVRRALLGVYDKTGIEELARGLADAGVELVSTGATARRIADAGVPVTPVEQVTGFPECLDGRVKTLHPAVHAGILADRRRPEHVRQLEDLGITAFDLVVVNLYPFTETVASGATSDECVEQIDIGGPAMVRAAAKNHPSVAVVVDPARYGDVLAAVAGGGFTLAQRQRLAAAAFRHTATYDIAVASWMGNVLAPDDESGFPAWAGASWERAEVLRYGENPHQRAALYRSGQPGLAHAEQLHGKQMSYNNYVDTDAAWRAAHDHNDPCVAIVKHANPCGIAVGTDVAAAHRKAHACDPVSAFGGVIAANREVDLAMAEQVAGVFTEVVVAPSFTADAVEVLTAKKNIRLLRLPEAGRPAVETRPVSGGLLLQTADRIDAAGDDPTTWTLATGEPLDAAGLDDLVFAWRSVRAVRSNAILLAHDKATVGVGMGQVNRVDAARLAVTRAGERAPGSVAASDAFFPFADGLQVLLDAGVRAVVQPGGSVRDEEVVAAARAAGVPLYLTGTRHFAH